MAYQLHVSEANRQAKLIERHAEQSARLLESKFAHALSEIKHISRDWQDKPLTESQWRRESERIISALPILDVLEKISNDYLIE